MSKIQLQPEIDFSIVLNAASKLKLSELETIVKEFNTLLESKKSKSKIDRIAELENLTNQAVLSNEKIKIYNDLIPKLESRTMTESERNIFSELTTEDELLQNQRISYMIELAQLRQVPFLEIKEQFTFNNKADV